MPREIVRLALPFAVSAEDRVRAFTENMEKAAVFYLAESERKKSDRRILKRQPEELLFIAEVCYPIWAIPWRTRTLLFDGLGIDTHKFFYDIMPDVETFNQDFVGSARKPEAYSTVLTHNANYFQNFASRKETTLNGLISNDKFIQDFINYLSEAEEIDGPLTDKVVLSPSITESAVSTSIEELSNLRAESVKDIKALSKEMRLLSTTSGQQLKVIHREIKEIRRKFRERIEKTKPKVREKLRKVHKKHHGEISMLSKRFGRQLHVLHRDLIKFEKMRERTLAEIKRCDSEIVSCRLRKDEADEISWRQKLDRNRKKLPTLQKNIQNMDEKIKDIEAVKKLETTKLRSKHDARVEKAMKELRELEASREAQIRMKQQEITSLEHLTAGIVDQVNEMIKIKKNSLKELDEVGILKKGRRYRLLHLPFYLACFEKESNRRYSVYPPSIISSMGILTKLKGVFKATKMKSFLQPQSENITDFLDRFITLILQNPVFEKEVTDAGSKASILRKKESRIGIQRGLKELKEEKWISESELQTYSKSLNVLIRRFF